MAAAGHRAREAQVAGDMAWPWMAPGQRLGELSTTGKQSHGPRSHPRNSDGGVPPAGLSEGSESALKGAQMEAPFPIQDAADHSPACLPPVQTSAGLRLRQRSHGQFRMSENPPMDLPWQEVMAALKVPLAISNVGLQDAHTL
jgi:hypothetical protein